jgi:hypothetical protein
LRWSIARSSAPTVSICSRVNSGRCAHTARVGAHEIPQL